MAKTCDIRTIVTRTIIEGLESGNIPWVRPWNIKSACNFDSKKPYRGLNQLLLGWMAQKNGWSRYWLTFKSIANHGWRLKADQHATQIAFFSFIDHKDDAGDVDGKISLLRYYNVFNLSQVDGVEIPVDSALEFIPDEKAEEIIKNMPNRPVIQYGGNCAYYNPKTDKVFLPEKINFVSIPAFYSTSFHEIGHSTGHPNRLNRKGVADVDHFGSEQYGLEELVAELTSAFLCAECGMEMTIQNSTAYIQNWLGVLKDNRQMLLTAAGQAQKATDFILGIKWEESKE